MTLVTLATSAISRSVSGQCPPIGPPHTEPGNAFCADDPFYPMAALAQSGGELLWYSDPGLVQLVGQGNYFVPLNTPGISTYYVVEVADEICISSPATVSIVVYETPEIEIFPPGDTLFISQEEIPVSLTSNVLSGNQWSDGSDSMSVSVSSSGVYTLYMTDDNYCTGSDSVYVVVREEETSLLTDDSLFIPNAFTPDNDGKNDELCVFANGSGDFRFKVFNRWGEKVFETSDVSLCWTGGETYFPGSEMFFYTLEREDDEIIRTESGYLFLIR